MKEINVIAIEGHSYSGKTHLFNKLKLEAPECNYVDENMVFARRGKVVKWNYQTQEEASANADFFVRIEKTRCKVIRDGVNFTDRSMISNLVFHALYNNNCKDIKISLNEVLEIWQPFIHHYKEFLPRKFIYLVPPSIEVYTTRAELRKHSIPFYKNINSLNINNQIFLRLFENEITQGAVLLTTSDVETKIVNKFASSNAVVSEDFYPNLISNITEIMQWVYEIK